MSQTVLSARVEDPPIAHRWSASDRFIPRAVVQPVQRFMQASMAGAVVMLAAALVALAFANSTWGHDYDTIWQTRILVEVGGWQGLSGLTLRDWVNDGAMAVFFFVAALEIKRELVAGELHNPRAAALPVAAAVGGMLAPALLYLAFNAGAPGQEGWGIPMATDIAFAVAVVTAAGARVPPAARLMLLTLAIVDDLGAIAVIAVFYTHGLEVAWLICAVVVIAFAWTMQRMHVRALAPYVALGVASWYALMQSGVHPTLAGVAFGLLTPVWSFHDPGLFSRRVQPIVEAVSTSCGRSPSGAEYAEAQGALLDLRRLTIETQSPVDRLAWRVGPWATFAVLPVFAFANAGIRLPENALTGWMQDSVSLGVVVGLVLGKPLGIMTASWLAVRGRIAVLPSGTSWRQLVGLSLCGGIGFTVALFVSSLAFDTAAQGDAARIGILVGSLISGVAGYLLLITCRPAATTSSGSEAANDQLRRSTRKA